MDDLQGGLKDNLPGNRPGEKINRREFIRRLALVTGGVVVGTTLLGNIGCGPQTPSTTPSATPTLVPPSDTGVTVDPNDPRIEAGPVEFATAAATMFGYLSRPKEGDPNPAVLVIHENRGMQPHFPDLTRRLALEGYTALSVDLLSRKGGTGAFADSGQARDALRELSGPQFLEDLNASVGYLQSLSHVSADRIGVTGFCFGGGLTWLLAVSNPNIKAAVPFYGSAPPLTQVPNMNAPVLAIYAEDDDRINSTKPELEAALKQNQKEYRFISYPETRHAFFNDTGGRYNPEAARQAWIEALSWFNRNLKA